MALMEFLEQNAVNTTTQMTAPSANTGTLAYLVDRNVNLGFTSVNYNTGTAIALGFTFSPAVTLSHVLIQNHNLKGFRLYYNSVTANSLSIVTQNSASTTYISFATVTGINSIDLQMDSTTVANNGEKAVGEIVFTERQLVFARNPSVDDWSPAILRKQIVHDMPDGGSKVYNIRDKYRTNLSWSFITQAFHDSLLAQYTAALPLYFVPFPTTTAWSGAAYEVVWTGPFDFKHGDNSKDQGFSGSMELRQTAGG